MSANSSGKLAAFYNGLSNASESGGIVENVDEPFLAKELLHLGSIGKMFGDVFGIWS